MDSNNEGLRGLVLTKGKGLPKLEGRILNFSGGSGLTYEALKGKSGLGVNTIRAVRNRKGSDYHTLYRLFRVLGLQLEDDDFERLRQVPPPTTTAPSTREQNDRIHIHNLPYLTSTFVGRKKEIEVVESLLGTTRLLTLTGFGGCGKTRLALQVAAKVRDHYKDGVFLVRLEALSDGSLVPQQIAAALELQEQRKQTFLETLIAYLNDKTMLLVLDNCEHLVTSCASVAESLLLACANLTLLATSREPLKIPGEQVWRVPSLPFPALDWLPEAQKALPSVLMEYDACQLFVERAKQHHSDWQLNPQNSRAVAQICGHLEGIPLAIELAAAHIRILSAEQIAERLFRLLRNGPRTVPSRHQTVDATLDWSYELLNEVERRLLGHLSVFAGGWTLEAAEQICSNEGKEDFEVLDLLLSLADRSLVLYAETGEEAGRYRLLETVRQYGRDRLVESGENNAVRERHRDYFLALAEQAEPKLTGAEQVEWLHRLEEEHENLRVALGWSVSEAGSSAVLRLCGSLSRFWYMRGHFSEGREWCVQALQTAGREERTQERAKALNAAGGLAFYLGDYRAAIACNEESLAIQKEIGDLRGMATSLFNLGRTPHGGAFLEECTLGRSYLEESLAIWRSIEDRHGLAASLGMLGIVASCQRDEPYGMECQEESLAIRREIGDLHGIALSLTNLGHVYHEQGDYIKASACFEESRDIQETIEDRKGEALSLLNLGFMACDRHKPAIARAYFVKTLNIVSKLGEKRGIANCLGGFGSLAQIEDQWERVAVLGGMHEALSERIGLIKLPKEQEAYERLVANLSQTLGEEAFLAAWAQGRSMTLEQAVEFALEVPVE